MLGWFGGYGFTGRMNFFTGTMHIPAVLAFLAILAHVDGADAVRRREHFIHKARAQPAQVGNRLAGIQPSEHEHLLRQVRHAARVLGDGLQVLRAFSRTQLVEIIAQSPPRRIIRLRAPPE
jgi:hypothetical protein